MTARAFDIVPDPARSLLRITMRGHWDLETVERYERALLETVGGMFAMGCNSGELVALVDAREGGAQSQEVIASYKDRLGGEQLAPRRLATLVSSALFKRQVERIAVPNQRIFADEAEALAWLLSPEVTS